MYMLHVDAGLHASVLHPLSVCRLGYFFGTLPKICIIEPPAARVRRARMHACCIIPCAPAAPGSLQLWRRTTAVVQTYLHDMYHMYIIYIHALEGPCNAHAGDAQVRACRAAPRRAAGSAAPLMHAA